MVSSSGKKSEFLAMLDRVLCIETCDEHMRLPPLEESQSEARRMRKQIVNASGETPLLIDAKMHRRIQALSSLLVMTESPESMSDDQWCRAYTLVQEEFGNTLAVAGARGRLRVRASVSSSTIGSEPAPGAEGSPSGSSRPRAETSEASEFWTERAPGPAEDRIRKEVDEILERLTEHAPDSIGGEGCNVRVEEKSAEPEPLSLPMKPPKGERDVPPGRRILKKGEETSSKWPYVFPGLAVGLLLAVLLAGPRRYQQPETPPNPSTVIEQPGVRPDPGAEPPQLAEEPTPNTTVTIPGEVADRVLPDVPQSARDTIPPTVSYAVQVGSFRERGAAERLREQLQIRYGGAFVERYEGNDGVYYRVRVGPTASMPQARNLAAQLQRENLAGFVVRLSE